MFAPTDVMTARAAEIIEAGRAARGHIFNLGHGVIPSTDPDQLEAADRVRAVLPRSEPSATAAFLPVVFFAAAFLAGTIRVAAGSAR